MQQVAPTQVTDAMRALFDPHAPAGLRGAAVMNGDIGGGVWTDDPAAPTWLIVQEANFGTLYLEGTFPAGLLADFIATRKAHGDVLYGFWPQRDALLRQLPPPDYDGWVLEGVRAAPDDALHALAAVPDGCALQPIHAANFPHTKGYAFYTQMFGTPERALTEGFGLLLVRGGDVLSESFAGTRGLGLYEMGVDTYAGHERNGYATVVCANVMLEAARRGYGTYWNCDERNVPSVRLAERLGYAPMQRYRLVAW